MSEIIILPYTNCLRSKKVLDFLKKQEIPFREVSPDSQEGQLLYKQYHFRASPGIIVDQENINPYDFLVWKECRIDEEKALAIFTASPKQESQP